jgi:hypothetical protein
MDEWMDGLCMEGWMDGEMGAPCPLCWEATASRRTRQQGLAYSLRYCAGR